LASPRIAAALAVLVVLLAGASVPLYAVTHQDVLANGGENIALAVIFGSVGLVIAWRQPRCPIGWLMLSGPALALLSIDGTLYAALTAPGRRAAIAALALGAAVLPRSNRLLHGDHVHQRDQYPRTRSADQLQRDSHPIRPGGSLP
jgi:hypothetical protein